MSCNVSAWLIDAHRHNGSILKMVAAYQRNGKGSSLIFDSTDETCDLDAKYSEVTCLEGKEKEHQTFHQMSMQPILPCRIRKPCPKALQAYARWDYSTVRYESKFSRSDLLPE